MRRLAALFALVTLPAGSACVGEIVGHETTEGPIEEECPLAPVGSRCAGSTTLEVCDGKEVATVDCAAVGQYCVEGPSGAACVGEGDNCGDVTAEGTCTEAIHTSCVEGVVQVTDCAATGQGCGYLEATNTWGCASRCLLEEVDEAGECLDEATYRRCVDDTIEETDCQASGERCGFLENSGWGCASECVLEGVDAAGECTSDAGYRRCEAGAVAEHECASDRRCFDDTSGPACLTSQEACAGLGPVGACTGDTLRTCGADGWPALLDCAAAGEVCAYAGDSTGYACMAAASAGASVVTGEVEYEDRKLTPGHLGPATPKPARSVRVAVVRNSDDSTLASAATADDGSYTLRYDAATGTALRVIAATSSQIPDRPIRVQKNSGYTHGLSSASFDAGPATVRDILLGEADDMARPFNVFDSLVDGMIFTKSLGATSIAPITANYQPGSNSSSYYTSNNNTIVLAGGSNDDGWDDGIVLHEFGHYHQDEYGYSDSPGGSHPNSGGDDPRLAWGEGQATAISMAVTGVPAYIDYNSSDGGWSVELENAIHDANASGSMSQYILEWLVAEVLWDAGDDGFDQDSDPVSGTHRDVHLVTTTYFHESSYVGRGYYGVDLVDWLDGYLLRMGAGVCSDLRPMISDWYEFPYDFAGPTPCP